MKLLLLSISLFVSFRLYSEPNAKPYSVEKGILLLSVNLDAEMMALSKYKNLQAFCNDNSYRQTIFSMLDQIHEYHDMLEKDLQETTYNHSRRTIERILSHMDKLDRKFNPNDFTSFFKEQCSFQSKIEKFSDHYKAGFGMHSYGGRVYAQEVVMYRYTKRLTKRIERIKRHVEHFYIRRKVWEHWLYDDHEAKTAMNMEVQKKKNSMTMLAYCKLILSKIEFDQGLLQKEYQKGIKYLCSDDIAELKRWLLINGKKIE